MKMPKAEGFAFIPRHALFLFVEMLGHLPGLCQVTHRKCLGCRDSIGLNSSSPLLALGHALGSGASVPSPGSRHSESYEPEASVRPGRRAALQQQVYRS